MDHGYNGFRVSKDSIEMLTQISDPLNIQGNSNEYNMHNSEGINILISKFMTLNILKSYAKTQMTNLMPELTCIQNQTLLLVNRDESE